MTSPLLALLLACGAPPPAAPPPAPAPAAAPAPAPRPSLDAVHATSHEGAPRTVADLRGHPTVVWFYPKAATGG